MPPAAPNWSSSNSTGSDRCQSGSRLLVSGKIDLFSGRRTISHPEHVVPADRPDLLPTIEPIWPLTGGLWPRQVASAIVQSLARLPSLPEWHDPALLRREKWPGFVEALHAIQAPTAMPTKASRTRLAYDELLADQVALALIRGRLRARPGHSLTGDGSMRAKALHRFGYELTRSQQQALAEIDADLASRSPHAPPAAGRCRVRQDRCRDAGHAVRGGGRQTGGADGADRGAGEAAPPHTCRACRPRRWRC